MTRRTRTALIAVALLTAACGGGADATLDESDPAGTAPSTTTTTLATTTPEAPAKTTTVPEQAETTTTTVAGTTDAVKDLLASMDAGGEIRSARIEGLIEMTGLDPASGGPADVSIPFTSAFDAGTGDTSFSMDMSAMAGAMEGLEDDPMSAALAAGMLATIEVRQIGDRAYLQFPLFTAMFGAQTDWVSMPADESHEFTAGMEMAPSDPEEVLEAYEDADATVEDLGIEPVNGTEATHYRILFDTEAMIEDLPADERAELEEQGLLAAGELPMDLWIDGEGHLVRMVMEIDGSTVDAPPGEGFESMTMRYDVYDINGDIVVEAPPAEEVTPIEDLMGSLDFGDLEPQG